ncbi:ubiquitin-associated domain-containing protein 1 isoform X2 [Thrips palmi]|uniref:Ubiquitin-associated domain-containing protein 1 isoform X2 n=1 Tax=Thrips palmi TaxID=161013 RepID=A0A6P8YYH1_THRPL|nr:ubiquitin-associated domain-containing protein 1 isoform X2 [Thrips palmi]
MLFVCLEFGFYTTAKNHLSSGTGMTSPESEHTKISVIYMGAVWKTKVSNTTKINKLLAMSLTYFHGPSTHSTLRASKHKMVTVRTREVLSGEKSLNEEGLRENEEVLLVQCRSSPPKQPQPDLRGPSTAEMWEATKDLEPRNIQKPGPKIPETEDEMDITCSIRFSIDSPRICITLFETAARLLAYAPNGMEVLQQVKKEISSKREPNLHSPYVKQLTDMGFSERMVLKALTAKRMNVSEAMEWLLEQSSGSKEEELPEPSTSQAKTLTVYESFQDLLTSALRRRHDNFKLNQKHFDHLKQMGYEERDIEIALRETDNSLKAALAWILGHTSRAVPSKLNQSLDPSGSMYKSMMASEIVQLNLKKPKFILALLSILEEPQSLSLWQRDRDVGCVLNHLSLLHNTESSGGRRVI